MSAALFDSAYLSSTQRRCLRVVLEFPDLAHAARRLHCSQATLKVALVELETSLGQSHFRLEGVQVSMSDALKNSSRAV